MYIPWWNYILVFLYVEKKFLFKENIFHQNRTYLPSLAQIFQLLLPIRFNQHRHCCSIFTCFNQQLDIVVKFLIGKIITRTHSSYPIYSSYNYNLSNQSWKITQNRLVKHFPQKIISTKVTAYWTFCFVVSSSLLSWSRRIASMSSL